MDQNEKFFVDGESRASVEFQGMEDSFGFSWGVPAHREPVSVDRLFPILTRAPRAYRFFLRDAISFQKSLRVTIGFGEHEDPTFRRQFSRPGSELQFSTTVYWYQTEPHRPMPPLPAAAERAPAQIWLSGQESRNCQRLRPCESETSSCTCCAAVRKVRRSSPNRDTRP